MDSKVGMATRQGTPDLQKATQLVNRNRHPVRSKNKQATIKGITDLYKERNEECLIRKLRAVTKILKVIILSISGFNSIFRSSSQQSER